MTWRSGGSRRIGRSICALLGVALIGAPAAAIQPKEPTTPLDYKEFSKPELYISSAHVPLDDILASLPNREAWKGYLRPEDRSRATPGSIFVDPRSGAVTNLIGSHPLIPGSGRGNRISLADLTDLLGRTVTRVDETVVAEATLVFLKSHGPLLGIDLGQLGPVRAVAVNPDLWQVSIPQVYEEFLVRRGRVAVTISHGNVVLAGTESWGNVRGLSSQPRVSAARALELGFSYADGRSAADELVAGPDLEIVPVAPLDLAQDQAFARPQGVGYRHRLVWTFTFQRPPDLGAWEVMVDAHSGELLAFADRNQYVDRKQITGGVYPVTSTGMCPIPSTCGKMQSGWPMPFADTGLPHPDDYTNGAGVFDWPGGEVATTLGGKFVVIEDRCGPVEETSKDGGLDLGGANLEHDCASAGASKGNTAASRTAFYEVNKIAEMARGWLPGNVWPRTPLKTVVNMLVDRGAGCNANYKDGTIKLRRSGDGCRNTGEIATVIDHEWGHFLDDNDANGELSITSEAFADIAAIYRQQTSCVGYGLYECKDWDCEKTADGTGFNADEDPRELDKHCDVECSGFRDADWTSHVGRTPDTPGFVCQSCPGRTTSPGPCGGLPHCEAAPSRQAAWDLVARDLQGSPISFDSETAFLIGNRLFYQGSGNIGAWHACTCDVAADSLRGCGAGSGYLQWLAADDDNGDLRDGTPHMTAIFNAFDRHGIACTKPAPRNRGCARGPKARPKKLTVVPGSGQVALSWKSVPQATRYWVFRTEGHAGCHLGKTRIAEVTGTLYFDFEVADGRSYSYNVVAAGKSESCFGPVSNCVTVTPPGEP